MEVKTILCVEDDEDSCQLLQYLLESKGYEVKTCGNGREALKIIRTGKFLSIILDYRLPDMSGVEICREIRSFDSKTPIIFYTGAAYPKDKKAGLEAGAQAYLIKPNDFEKIVETVRRFVL
jgi:Response regulator containing CheY-like receiver, AAA-type ATPase, and DNA-binding domains